MSVRFETVGRHGEIVLDRPAQRNAIDDALLVAFDAALDAAQAAGVRALLVRGEGKTFCAGRDLESFDPQTDDPATLLREHFHPLMARLAEFPAPTIAAVHGAALGAGLGLALACDVVYIADDAKVGSPFRALGLVLDSGGHHFLVRRVGAPKTFELIYSGRLIDGREAERLGLVARSLGASSLLAEARRFAELAATGPTAAFRESKAIVREIERDGIGLAAVLEREAAAQGRMIRSRDALEGVAAFREKRRPSFEGR